MIDETVECVDVTADPRKYDLETAHLRPANGVGEWFTWTGPGQPFEKGKRYRVRVEEVQCAESPTPSSPAS